MKLNGMYVTKIDCRFEEHFTITLKDSVSSSPTVRVMSIEESSDNSEAVILEDEYQGDKAVIKALESLGYEKEEIGASYSFTDPAWIKKQDSHYGYDWGGSL